jgi:ABC-type glycerol-3-phosphate transport system permease component
MVNKNKKWIDALYYFILIAVFLVTVFPLVYITLSSFKTNGDILAHPEQLITDSMSFDNYKRAWNSPQFQVKYMIVNSLYYTLGMVCINMLISSMAGYVFSRGHFPGKKIVFGCFTALMFIQTGGIGIYATFEILNLIHLPQSLPTLMLIGLFGVPTVNMYLVKGYVDTLPVELNEAAKIDGASFPRTFFMIMLPLLLPIMATIGILAFNGSWNNYLMPTVFTLTRPKQRTLIVGLMALKNSGGAATQWDLMLAGSVITIIPVLSAYIFANKYFVQGLASGAVKG